MIEICNLRYESIKFDYDVRVDRSNVLGNPFVMKNEWERDEVIEKYKEYFEEKIKKDEKFLKELYRLRDLYKKYGKLRLFCWCFPKKCHAEVIKFFVEYELVD